MNRVGVLYVIWSLETGGAEQVVISLATQLPRSRYRPVVCCLNWEGKLADAVKAEGIPVISLQKKPGFSPSIIPRLVRVMRDEKIDVVHTHLWTSNFWGRIAARLAGVPCVVSTEHNIDVWKSRHHFLADRMLSRWSDRVVYVSDCVREFYVGKTGIDRPKGVRIYNGIDIEGMAARADGHDLRAELGIAPGAPVISTIGRLVPQKGHRIFLEALKRIRAEVPETVGLIVGQGECREDLEAYARELDLDDGVRFTGLRGDIGAILATTDVFVLSSYREGFPITILEAMAVGRPCVVTDVGGNREAVVHGETGFLPPCGDAAALAEPIVRLLSDPSLMQEMGQAARERVQSLFSVETMVRETGTLYDQLLGRSGQNGSGATA